MTPPFFFFFFWACAGFCCRGPAAAGAAWGEAVAPEDGEDTAAEPGRGEEGSLPPGETLLASLLKDYDSVGIQEQAELLGYYIQRMLLH